MNPTKPVTEIEHLNIKNTTSFYYILRNPENSQSNLVIITFVPLNHLEYKGLLIIKKVDFHKLYPQGPFNLEVYSGNQISPDNILIKIKDPFAPAKFNNLNENSFESSDFEKFELEDLSGKTAATFVLKMNRFPPPPLDILFQIIGIILLFVGAFSSLFVGFYIKQNFINPFLLISDASKKVQGGDFSSCIKYDSKNSETKETIDRFNKMIEGLKEKEELRNSFISSLTHDLRTPLIAQNRAIEYIINELDSLSLDEPLQLSKGMAQNNQHLLRMVNLLLESYHFDSNEIHISLSNIDLYELINTCYETIQPLAKEKNIQLINNINKDLKWIQADKPSIKRVFLNLTANAIENTKKEGKIEITIQNAGDYLKIVVEDNGVGIPKEDLAHLFDKYYMGKSNARRIGSGLGLYICKGLIELNQGKITVESEIGKFTRFIITLPNSLKEKKCK